MIHIDLRERLPRLVAALPTISRKSARYRAPCAVGALLTPEERAAIPPSLDAVEFMTVLEDHPTIFAPAKGQVADIVKLQRAHDYGDHARFIAEVNRLKEKYL